MKTSSSKASTLPSFIFRAVAMAMAVAVIVLGILGTVETSALITLLGIGLFTLSLDALDRGPKPG